MDGEKIKLLIARNIKTSRKRLNLTQHQLAEKVNTSTSFIGEIEICRKFPSPANIERIARALGLKPHELFYDDEHIDINRDKKDILARLKRDLTDSINDDINDIIVRYLSE